MNSVMVNTHIGIFFVSSIMDLFIYEYNIIPISSHKFLSYSLAAVKETLSRDGFLNKLQAEMRVRVIGLLGEELQGARGMPEKPRLPQEILFLNELIREYLEWMAYTYTNSIFISG